MTLNAAWLLVQAGAVQSVSQTADLPGFPCIPTSLEFTQNDLQNGKYTVSSSSLSENTTLMPQENEQRGNTN